jgi:hypothetical protein
MCPFEQCINRRVLCDRCVYGAPTWGYNGNFLVTIDPKYDYDGCDE